MSYPFNGQSISINIDINTDISAGSNFSIKYVKPDKTKGSWSASRSGTNIGTPLTNGEIDQWGVWSFQPYYEVSGEPYYCEIVEQYVGKNLIS